MSQLKYFVPATGSPFTPTAVSGTTITVSSTANLTTGMYVENATYGINTTISSITNSTQFVVASSAGITTSTPLNIGSWVTAVVGQQGYQGYQGSAATVNVGTTSTVSYATGASVTNSGSQSTAVFNFSVPQGPQGYQGQAVTGPQGPQGYQGIGYYGVTSITQNTLSTGTYSLTWAVSNSGAFAVGQRVRAALTSLPTTWASGTITALTANSSITVLIDTTNGTATTAGPWTFSTDGLPGPQGVTGSQGFQGYGYIFVPTNSFAPQLGSFNFSNSTVGSYSITAYQTGGRVRLVATSSTSVYVEGINTGPTGGFGNNTNVTIDTIGNNAYGTGVSTTITATTLVQSAYTWPTNIWVGAVVTVGTTTATVTSNNATTLTFTGNWSSTTPANVSSYSISFSSWSMSVAGNVGLQGPQGTAGSGNMSTTTYDPAAIAQQIVGTTAAQTVTNKRITKRILSLSANSATPTINTDSYDVVHITAQTAAITSFTTNLTGTPVDGDTLRISVTGTTGIPLTWGTKFEPSTATLPTTTTSTTRLDVGFFWNTETSKWRCVAVA